MHSQSWLCSGKSAAWSCTLASSVWLQSKLIAALHQLELPMQPNSCMNGMGNSGQAPRADSSTPCPAQDQSASAGHCNHVGSQAHPEGV